MAGFTADAQGRPRSNVPPPEEAEPFVRSFARVGARLREGASEAAAGAAGAAAEPAAAALGVFMDTGAWGGLPSSSGRRPSLLLGDDGPVRAGGEGGSSGDNFILATGVAGAGAESAAVAVGSSSSGGSSSATRALFVGGVQQLSRAVDGLQRAAAAVGPLLVLRMGEWSKFKYWSKAAYDMDWEWRRDFQKARNQTLEDREEMMRVNGTDPWAPGSGRKFDFELWTILRTLSGQNGNNRF